MESLIVIGVLIAFGAVCAGVVIGLERKLRLAKRNEAAYGSQLETARNAITELTAQLRDYSGGLGYMRSLWPALQPIIVFTDPVTGRWDIDLKSLEIMVSVVKFGPEITAQLAEAKAQMVVLPPQEVHNDAARH